MSDVGKIKAALSWYGEQARLCRLIHSEGDVGRQALANDGGKRAIDALEQSAFDTLPDDYEAPHD